MRPAVPASPSLTLLFNSELGLWLHSCSIVSAYLVPFPSLETAPPNSPPSTLVYHICYRCNTLLLSLKQLTVVPISAQSAGRPPGSLSISDPCYRALLAAWLGSAPLTPGPPPNFSSPSFSSPSFSFLYSPAISAMLPLGFLGHAGPLSVGSVSWPTFPFPLMTWFSLLAIFSLLLPPPALDPSRCFCLYSPIYNKNLLFSHILEQLYSHFIYLMPKTPLHISGI